MPAPEAPDRDAVERAVAALVSPECAAIVDVALCRGDGVVEAHARDGAVGFTAAGPAWVRGRNPLERQDAAALSPLAAERAGVRPAAGSNHYPFAYDN
ncbi:MAG: hypothetical protein ACRDJM_06425, partial [Actinomycetota bacterium]